MWYSAVCYVYEPTFRSIVSFQSSGCVLAVSQVAKGKIATSVQIPQELFQAMVWDQ
jgi:hypothetical protein